MARKESRSTRWGKEMVQLMKRDDLKTCEAESKDDRGENIPEI